MKFVAKISKKTAFYQRSVEKTITLVNGYFLTPFYFYLLDIYPIRNDGGEQRIIEQKGIGTDAILCT